MCRAIWKKLDAPIIVIMPRVENVNILELYNAGGEDIILMPFFKEDLFASIKLTLMRRKFRQSLQNVVPGMLIGKQYKVLNWMRRGGFSTVFKAKILDGPAKGQIVAVKILVQCREKERTVFLREAHQLSTLNHPNIVQFMDFGQLGSNFYIITEFIKGSTLAEWLQLIKEASAEALINFAHQILSAICYMEDNGVIHRDIKPANLILTDSNELKIIDFGLARHNQEKTLSIDNSFVGSPHFIAPERFNGQSEKLNSQCDIYSLGMTLYYLAMGGDLPFSEYEILEILKWHLHGKRISIRSFRCDFDRDLDKLILSMIHPQSHKRPGPRNSLLQISRIAKKKNLKLSI